MTGDDDFEQIIAGVPETVQALARQARATIYAALPGVTEIVWTRQKIAGYGTGPKKNSEHFCWLQPGKKHLTFGFNYGAELPDPEGLLEGTGKLFRHVKVRDAAMLESAPFRNMLAFATTHRVPSIRESTG